jgi:threonyl-tRNA synthetase
MAKSDTIELTFPDGRRLSVPIGTRAGDALSEWHPNESPTFLAAILEGVPIDLDRRLERAGSLAPLTFSDRLGRDILQHSSAHLVAKAVTETVPEARPTVGPPTEDGFYYDFDMRPLTPDDMARVLVAMQGSVQREERFERRELSRDEAALVFASNPHKLGYIREVPLGEPITVYATGSFLDLCRGPHVPSTRWLRGIHILGFSAIKEGGTPDGAPLQRIRGVGFPDRAQLDQYLKMRAEAEARDHRVIGQRQELFLFTDEAPGFPFWLPKGMILVRELERYVTEHLHLSGYSEIRTPLLFAQSVYETSGHWEHYRENMFLTIDENRAFGWKPMNCPGSMLMFRSRARSYRELPMRLAEFAPLHRREPSGTLHGLTRVREMVQDDAHIFVTEEQVVPELRVLLDWIREAFTTFRLSWSYELSTRPAGSLGDAEDWDRATATLESVLKTSGVEYRVSAGEGAFYAPKIDIHVRDSLGRPWQTGTIQLDYQMPRRFLLEYQGADGQLHTPIVIHRTILGTWERFLGVFIEHCAGRFPPWMAPVQVRILPVTDRNVEAANGLREELSARGIRVEVSEAHETLGKRVRSAELDRIPYVAVVGDAEAAIGSVAVRVRGEKGQQSMSRPEFLERLLQRIQTRSYDP